MSLFKPFELRGIQFRNRLGLAPMSQYRAANNEPVDWHRTHYATRAIGQGLVIVEATAVCPAGLVTPQDLGIWSDAQIPPLAGLAALIATEGSVPGLQLSHGGRKASRTGPWDGDRPLTRDEGGWPVLGPSAEAFGPGYAVPAALDEAGIALAVDEFARAADRAHRAGFQFLELHAGHGRLLHNFLSPVSNHRTDRWGGDLENRSRFLLETVRAVRCHWPDDLPLSVRLSCVDWVEGGWSIDDSVQLAGRLLELGVDLIDCSSGGIRRPLRVERRPGYQVGFAREIRRRTGIATAAVGLITDLSVAHRVIEDQDADLVLMGRRLLTRPLLLVEAVQAGAAPEALVPPPYRRAVAAMASTPADAPFLEPEL